MKKYFIMVLLMLALCMWACSESNTLDSDDNNKTYEDLIHNLKHGDLETITIEGCDYLIFMEDMKGSNKGFGFMTHKGNCNNPIHIYQDTTVFKTD